MSKESGGVHPGRVLRERIAEGETLWGLIVSLPVPGILELARDWDWFWVDGQHGQLSYDTILNLARVAELVDVPAMVRVAGHDYSQIGPVLDTGVAGVIVPMVHNADQARDVVMAAKFAPVGGRSIGGRRVMDRDGADYYRTANDDVVLLGQIESVEGFDNAEQIAAVAGIDGLLFGPVDYSLDRGVCIESGWDAHLWEVSEKIGQICRNHGKIAASLSGPPERARRLAELGYQMLARGSDAGLFHSAAAKALSELRRATQKD